MKSLDQYVLIFPSYHLCLSSQAYLDIVSKLEDYSIPDLNWMPDSAAAVTHTLFSDYSAPPVCIVCMNMDYFETLDKYEVYEALAHEAVHIYEENVRYMAEKFPGEEHRAYSMGILVKNLIREYDRQTCSL